MSYHYNETTKAILDADTNVEKKVFKVSKKNLNYYKERFKGIPDITFQILTPQEELENFKASLEATRIVESEICRK